MKELNIAIIAGLGVVGSEVARILTNEAEMLASQAGMRLAKFPVAVSARSNRDRGFLMQGIDFVEDATQLVTREEVDIIVELIAEMA